MTVLSLSAFLGAIGCIAAINLVREHSAERTCQATPASSYEPSLFWLIAGTAAATTLVSYAHLKTSTGGWGMAIKIAGSITGLLLAGTAATVAFLLQFWLTDGRFRKGPTYLVLPFDRIPFIGQRLKQWADKAWNSCPSLRFPELAFAQVPTALRAGLFYRASADGKWRPYPGHLFATAMAVISVAIWLILGYSKQLFIAVEGQSGLDLAVKPVVYELHLQDTPTLVFVIVFLLVLNWTLSGLCFFFDRYRVPVLVVIAVFAGLTSLSQRTDHYYRVDRVQEKDGVANLFPSAASILSMKLSAGRVPVVIATAGGGIQAAAWTVKVAEQLERIPAFQSDVALISSVSGGSIGAAYLGAAWSKAPRKAIGSDEGSACEQLSGLERANCLVRRTSLDDVAWGLFNPDVWRVIQPFFRDRTIDRGWALEERLSKRTGLANTYLADWAEQAGKGDLPAFIFNATAVETGSPVALATTDFPGPHNDQARRRFVTNFHNLYKAVKGESGLRLRVVTAARLSATFPYVSPLARADLSPRTAHLADGGYYDNYGLLSAIDWLYEAMQCIKPNPPVPQKIAVVIIRNHADGDAGVKARGWDFQFSGPLDTILNTRDTSQRGQDDAQLCAFRRYWKQQLHVDIGVFNFEYPIDPAGTCNHQPVSWKLTEAQNQCIDDMWPALQSEYDRLATFLGEKAQAGDQRDGDKQDNACVTGGPGS